MHADPAPAWEHIGLNPHAGIGRTAWRSALVIRVEPRRPGNRTSDDAVAFYQVHDVFLSPLGERVLVMPIERVRDLLHKDGSLGRTG